MLKRARQPFGDSSDRNIKVRSLLLTKNSENAFGEEVEDPWTTVKVGQKCLHSSFGSLSSINSPLDQLDDNVFKTPPKEPHTRAVKAGNVQRKITFDIGIESKEECTVKSNRVTNSKVSCSDHMRLIRSNVDGIIVANAARLRDIWRYRLGSSGDRVTSSPPHICHKDIKKIKLKCLIGHGGFGAVYLGVIKDKIVAVKRLHKRVKNARAKLESFRAECNVLNLKHPNIVQVLAASIGDSDQEAIIVMEFAGDRNLLSVINDSKQSLDLSRRIKYSLEIAKALQFIHSNGVVHLDLKPANVIITSKDECKLGDFGCCRLLRSPKVMKAREASGATDDKASPSPVDDDDFRFVQERPYALSQLAGTFVYRAPELLKGDSPGPRSDVYSLGVTMWQMLSRRTPYAGKDRHAVIFGVVAYNVRPSFDFACESDDAYCLLSLPGTTQRTIVACDVSVPNVKSSSPGENRYKGVVESCWSANQTARPWPSDLVEIFQNWK